MIHKKAKTVGGILLDMPYLVANCLQVDNEPAFDSIFFGPDFLTITIWLHAIFLGSLLSDFRQRTRTIVSQQVG